MADGNAPLPLVVFTPSGKRGRFAVGTPVLQAARDLGVDLDSVCGGRGICSRCQITPSYGDFSKHGVTAREGALSEWNAVEERYREKRGLKQGRRLGCQAKVEGDIVIDVPPESQVHKQVVRKDADDRVIELDPSTKLFYVVVREPDMHDPSSDMERLKEALEEQWELTDLIGDLQLMQRLQPALREGKWHVTCALHIGRHNARGRIVNVWPGLYEGTIYGAAFDIGSTTVACHLSDLRTGATVASSGLMNPQIRFGEDLMSRVSYAMMNPEGASQMTEAVREAINALLGQVAAQAMISTEDIFECTFVGNPIMHHLLLGIDPVELGGAPFALAAGEGMVFWASEIGVNNTHPDARVYTLPCIAGHVGADAAAVILAEEPYNAEEITLIVDVGTNAEIVLGNRDRLLACSSPTGPAFEGAQISCGQRAAPGAIERVRIDPDTKEPRFKVIGCELWSDDPGFARATGETGVTGIAGSGIIEAIAEMRLADVIDIDGVVRGALSETTPRVFAEGRTFSYLIHDGNQKIMVTQNDVRAIQLAKAALYAGCQLLMDELQIESVDRITLAGAFGAHISPKHAMVLGMIPDCEVENVRSAGNAAGTGARIALLNAAKRTEIERVVRDVEKIETALAPKFQDHFIQAMAVPHKTAPYPRLSRIARLPDTPPAPPPGTTGDGGRRRRRART